jgi:hypothetical protein
MKKIATPERIEIWQIDRLKLNPKNARTHSPEQSKNWREAWKPGASYPRLSRMQRE